MSVDRARRARECGDGRTWRERALDAEAERDKLRKALRRAYPYVMDALIEAEENSPNTTYIVLEDLKRFIVPALAPQDKEGA